MAKIFKYHPHHGAKARGKDLVMWVPKEDDPLEQAEIPEWEDAMEPDDEYVNYEWLSGGQWQKVAMARAFMKIREAELLILDEPSSALDPQAEYELFKTLMELRRGKTTIFIVLSWEGLADGGSHIDFILCVRRIRFW
jgi:ABC-type lipoprotein export system ATPase subunit